MPKTRLARKMLRYTSMSQLNIKWEGWSSESIDIHFYAPMTRIAVETSKPAVPNPQWDKATHEMRAPDFTCVNVGPTPKPQ